MPDSASISKDIIVGSGNWQQQLNTNKAAFIDAFVQRPAFRNVYDNLTDQDYVDMLIANTGVNFSQSERAALVNGLTGGSLTRAAVLRQLAENGRFISAKFNQTFVMMEYGTWQDLPVLPFQPFPLFPFFIPPATCRRC